MIVESYEDVVLLSGSLHSNQWEAMHTAISLTLKRHPSGVIIDCSNLTSMTVEGAETFHEAIQFVQEQKEARVIVACLAPELIEILKSVPDVRSQLPLAKSVEEARRSLDLTLEEEETGKKKKLNSRTYERKVLATMCPAAWDDYLLRLLEDLIERDKTKVVLLIPIIVPRELPLQSLMADIEEKAASFVSLAKRRLEEAGIGHEIIVERARDYATLVQETAEEVQAAHVLLGLSGNHNEDKQSAKMFQSLMERVTRPLIFARGEVAKPAE